MKIYNTLTKKKETFKPIDEGKAKIYACGPTVYNLIHIGNARPICVFDILRRFLEYRNYEVTFVQNFTDIDDKIINKAFLEGVDYKTIAERYIKEYYIDAKGLGVKDATYHPRATENIDEIIDLIECLVEKDAAYLADNGDVYFNTQNFENYGKLSNQPLDDLESGARISVDDVKENPMDFVLWKKAKSHEPSWDSPWGKGRPGWHIECSAMARRYLGNTIDIHCGGQDLIFPHHENEVAQSECCNGVTFSNYWMHNGYINIDNRKMSKSLDNFFTVRDVADKYGYEVIRYMLISSHYRSPVNYSLDLINQSLAALERLHNCYDNLTFTLSNAKADKSDEDKSIMTKLDKHRESFIIALENDLNTADALASMFELAKDINTHISLENDASKELCKYALDLFLELNSVIGAMEIKEEKSLDEEVEALIKKREEARENKDWATADKIRDELQEKNIVLEDTPQGIKWSIKE